MSPQANYLDQLSIPVPCSADWELMTGDGRARFCSHCAKNVYDLSAMTRREAEALIASKEGKLCGRVFRRPDGSVLTSDCHEGSRIRVRRLSKAAVAALSAMLAVNVAPAQTPSGDSALVQIQKAAEDLGVLTVVVKDITGAVIPDAEVEIVDELSKAARKFTSDQAGRIPPQTLNAGSYTISISAVGFRDPKKKIEIASGQGFTLDAVLELGEVNTGVIITAKPFHVLKAHSAPVKKKKEK